MRSTTAAVASASARGTKNEKAAGRPGKLVRMASRYRAVPSPSAMPQSAPCNRERRSLGENLPHDGGTAHSDCPQGGDLAETLAHGDGEYGRDEQHGHDEAHRTQDVGELAEVDQPLVELDDQVDDAVHLKTGMSIAKTLRYGSHGAVLLRLHDDDRRAIVALLASQALHDGEEGAHRSLPP